MQPQRRKPTRLPRPWDSPGKNTGVGCHFLFQCMKVKSESEIAQWCPTLSDPMDCSLTGSSVHGIFQARGTGVGCHCLEVLKCSQLMASFTSLQFLHSAPGPKKCLMVVCYIRFTQLNNSSLSSIQQILLCFPQILKIFCSVSELSAVPLGALALSLEMAVIRF